MVEHELERLVVRLVGDAQSYQKMLQEAAAETRKTAAEVETSAKKIEGLAGAFTKFGGAAAASLAALKGLDILKESFGNFSEAEGIGIRLTATLEANGREVESLRSRYEDFARDLENVTTLEDDHVLSLLAAAEAFDLTGPKAEKAVKDAAALAAAKGGSAATYLRFSAAMAKGDLELAMSMGRLIPELRNVKDETEFVAKATKLVAAGERALAAETATAAGQLKMLGRDFGNALEDVGKFVAEGIQPAVEWLREAVAWFRQLPDGVKAAATAALALSAAIAAVTAAYTTLKALGITTVFAKIIAATYAWATVNATLSGSLAAVGVAAVAVAAVGITTWIVQNTEAAKSFNAELDKMARQTAFSKQQLAGRADRGIARAEQEATSEGRIAVLQQEVEKAKKIVAIHKQAADEAKAHYDEVNESVKGPITRLLDARVGVAEKNLQGQQGQLREAEAAARKLEDALQAALNPKVNPKLKQDIAEVTKKLHEQVQTFGLSESAAAVYKLELAGATLEMVANVKGLAQMVDWLKEDKKAKEEAAEAAKKLADEATNMATELEASLAMFGMSAEAAKIYKMELEGLDPAIADHLRGLQEQKDALEAEKKAMEDAAQLKDQILGKDPQRKFGMQMERLEEHLAAGRISWDVFNLGVKQAEEELAKAGKTADTMKQKFDAALAGGAEGRQRIQQFYDALDRQNKKSLPAEQRFEAVQRGGAEGNQREQKQLEKLDRLVQIGQRQLDRPALMVEPANL